MRTLDSSERATCAFQGKVFELSAECVPDCGSAVFVRRFMRSDAARRIDAAGLVWDGAEASDVVREVHAAYLGKPYGHEIYPGEVLYWMGYVYRYGCLVTGLSSKALYGLVGAREMRDLYLAYHTLDPAQCVERLLEAKGVDCEEDLVARGVEALRRIRARST